jgi:hypothetical protein
MKLTPEIQRWKLSMPGSNCIGMVTEPDGEWVQYADHQAEMERKEIEHRDMVEGLRQATDDFKAELRAECRAAQPRMTDERLYGICTDNELEYRRDSEMSINKLLWTTVSAIRDFYEKGGKP